MSFGQVSFGQISLQSLSFTLLTTSNRRPILIFGTFSFLSQEKGHEITTQVFQGCGKPTLGNLKRVNKRETPNATHPFANKTVTTAPKITRAKRKRFDNNRAYNNRPHSANENNGKRRNKNNNGNKNGRKQSNACKHHARNKDNSLDRLIVDVCEQLQEHKKFFANLPYKACHGDLTSNSGDQNCWNGRTVDRYSYAVVSANEHNPEVTSKLSNRQNTNISQFLFKFKNAIGNLRNSFNGLDVEWPDQGRKKFIFKSPF
jgi:Glypican